jgi:hypothetical protein
MRNMGTLPTGKRGQRIISITSRKKKKLWTACALELGNLKTSWRKHVAGRPCHVVPWLIIFMQKKDLQPLKYGLVLPSCPQNQFLIE